MDKYKSWRWVILCLGIAANLVLGISYAGSVISKPMLLMVGVVDQPAELKSHWGPVFSLGLAFLPLGMIIAGWLADKKGPRLPIALGAVTFASGAILASFATSYAFLCFTFGFMTSLGCGLTYGPVVASAVRWFPDRRGLASGLAVGALGFGPVWIAPFSSIMLNTYGFEIPTVLCCLGVITLIVVGIAAFFVTSPPADFQVSMNPRAAEPQEDEQKPAASTVSRDVAWTGMIATTDFWILFFLFVLGATPGMMLISQANGIFVDLGKFSLGHAAVLVGVLGAANALGRVFWGAVSDYLGRLNTLTVMFACSAVTLFMLPFATYPILLATVVLVIGMTYGGYLGLFPSLCAESFGLKNVTLNYAILFIAFAVSAFAGPQIYSLMTESAHAFFTAAALALLGGIVTAIYKMKKRMPGT